MIQLKEVKRCAELNAVPVQDIRRPAAIRFRSLTDSGLTPAVLHIYAQVVLLV